MRGCNWLSVALLAIGSMSEASPRYEPPIPPGFNDAGPAPQNFLPKIMSELRKGLKDPYSLRDLRVCEPKAGGAYLGLEWHRATWSSLISFNAKNSFGAYSGITVFHVKFEKGEVVSILEEKGISVLSAAQNAELMDRTRAIAIACPLVSEVVFQQLLRD